MAKLLRSEEVFELPVYIVVGDNWECEVALEEKDIVLSGEDLIFDEDENGKNKDDLTFFYDFLSMEAATKAIEVFKKVKPNTNFLLYNDKEKATVAATLYVYLKDENPDNGQFVPSFVAFGNAGFYKDALQAYKLHKKEIKEYEKEQLKKKEARAKNKKKK